jgi:mono/diheme cytochrome c family protein
MRMAMAALVVASSVSTIAMAQTPPDRSQVERGRYLMESIVACGNCHTPQGPNGPVMNRALSGGPPIVEPNAFTALPS